MSRHARRPRLRPGRGRRIIMACLLVLALAAALLALFVNRKPATSGRVEPLPPQGAVTGHTRPPHVGPHGDLVYLVIAADHSRPAATAQAITLLRLGENDARALTIPTDLYASVPEWTDGRSGQRFPAGGATLAEAFGRGSLAEGNALLVADTLEDVTGIRIDHTITFGSRTIAALVNRVPNLTGCSTDPMARLWEGLRALPLDDSAGASPGRTPSSPPSQSADSAPDIDSDLTGAELRRLATTIKAINQPLVQATIKVTEHPTVDSRVPVVDQSSRVLLESFGSAGMLGLTESPAPPPTVRVRIVNVSEDPGLGTLAATALRTAGFAVEATSFGPPVTQTTTIRYAPGQEAGAAALSAALPQATVLTDSTLTGIELDIAGPIAPATPVTLLTPSAGDQLPPVPAADRIAIPACAK